MYLENIKEVAKENTNFRQVLYTTPHTQLVVMSLLPGEDIGEETHEGSDQILHIVAGKGEAIVDGKMQEISKHSIVVVPAGTLHNIKNTGEEDMKLFTIYAPATHADGTIHATKADAQKE